jgi:hypothetical protein
MGYGTRIVASVRSKKNIWIPYSKIGMRMSASWWSYAITWKPVINLSSTFTSLYNKELTMKATNVKEGLIATKWILENYGWCKGYYQVNEEGNSVEDPITQPFCGSCLSGAMQLVEYEPDNISSLTRREVCDFIGGSIPFYNDTQERTKEEVIALLDRLIAEA